MHRRSLLIAAVAAPFFIGTVSAQPPRPQPPGVAPRHHAGGNLQQWSSKLVDEISRLQDDLYYERDRASRKVRELADQALNSAVHFNQVVRRGGDERHLARDFRNLDERVHALLNELRSMQPSSLRRAASRIGYADQQLHYYVYDRDGGGRDHGFRERVTRHARVLEVESRQLAQAAKWRIGEDRGEDLVEDLEDFAESAAEFRRSVEHEERDDIFDEFAEVDEQWHEIVRDINRSRIDLYVRRNAAQVNQVHNQLHSLIGAGHSHRHDGRPDRDRDRRPRDRDRPHIEFEIPGFGRFQIGND